MLQNQKSLETSLSTLKALSKENGRGSKDLDNNSFTVVKRNGSLVPFRRDRIFKALEMAFRDTKKLDKETPFSDELLSIIQEITDTVMEELLLLAANGICLTVEGIQDMVEITLMKQDQQIAAKFLLHIFH